MSILSTILAAAGGIYSAKMTQQEAQRNRDWQKMNVDTFNYPCRCWWHI
nr:MAG TPA: Kti11p finger, METAL BINDING PROTEIN [Microviridae sp.]